MTATDLVQFGATDLRVSRICQGTAFRNMPREAGNIAGQKVLEHCIEAGVNFFDSSNAYGWGGSEELLGKAMAGKRDHVVVCTKVAASYGPEDESLPREPARFTREFLFHQVEASLSRLGTEYTDLYLLHQPDGVTPAEEIADSMEALIAAGKVRYWGVSNHCAEAAEQVHFALKGHRCIALRRRRRVLHRDCPDQTDSYNHVTLWDGSNYKRAA